jgi:thiol:disulfide interchange protein
MLWSRWRSCGAAAGLMLALCCAPASAASTPAGVGGIPNGYPANANASADVAAALAAAGREHREVLLDFGADWCPNCMAIDKIFHSPTVEPLLVNDYVAVAVDVGEWNLNVKLTARYINLDTSGIPALVVLAPSGKIIATTNSGTFENVTTSNTAEVAAWLTRWAHGSRP